ncbi:MAG TPA: hypothetical protein VGQ21_17520 [Thermoanaerobaculia bacterium]|nr:hypothetical protein [Thermoanaerobaculia bacterium]
MRCKRMDWKLFTVLFLAGCASTSMPVPQAWESVPKAAPVRDYCAHFECAGNLRVADIRVAENQLFNGTKALTPRFAAIDSYDVSVDRQEVVFSAKRTDNFDIGLVSMAGSDIHWIPEDPVDEVNVQWAPRGNKVSYILHTPTSSIVRTVHIPTATPLSIDFPTTQIDALSWEPKAERFALVLESPDVSQHAVSMTYAGEKREELVAASDHLDVSLDPIGGVLVMRPNAMRYNDRLPLVVWADDKPFAWSDARAALMRNAHVAIAIAPKTGDNFWTEIRKVPWIDTTRTYIVGDGPAEQAGNAVKIIKAGDSNRRYLRRGNTLFVPSAVVQSFAAAYIADDLKGTPPPNGRR